MDRAIVIVGLAALKEDYLMGKCRTNSVVIDEAIRLLKMNEKRQPIKLPALPTMTKEAWRWGCPKCEFDIGYNWKFCHECGQEMDWSFLGASS